MANLESQRLYILKRLGILKFLSVIEALLVGFLAFVFIKDVMIAIISAIFVGVFFYRFTSKRLIKAKKELEFNVLKLFLTHHKAYFPKKPILQKEFASLNLSENLKEFQAGEGIEFKSFTLYDVKFKDELGRFFCGICLISKQVLNGGDENQIYKKVVGKNFELSSYFAKDGKALIACLANPFFVDLKKSVEENHQIMQGNLEKLNSLLNA
ncbi:poly(A) polymerase [Campylobacter vulpis]|uniref:Poly(A) polymerase n=1 Tax=Campylobacter vulpis TaxID=1655500 RepID=A0ABS5P2B8_9BACT|nr:poly(A) polymerase [Campylobacter vulpis]MBS4240821.1 poly(A) polymerase [Campylobacter vulpis]MBS4252366.1 poly(A) polymerase [Campylobacter vulpis]MBS4281593.1 poly(A) polymerase [Campylobacter vulpis]MBS4406546.1 poly(A) polymerase [Campylobacter vulpis]